MDASISDILDSVTRAHEAASTITGVPSTSSETSKQPDLQQLTRAWVAERVAPEILPYPTELLDRVMMRIRQQVCTTEARQMKIETIEDRTSRMDAGTSFALVVMQTELERFKFLIRSFLRARMAKIDAHPYHLLSLPTSEPPLLSPSETQYLQAHAALLSRHYSTSFLSAFPAKLRRLDDRAGAGGVGMVEGPDLDKSVFVRCLGVLNVGSTRTWGGFDEDEDDDEMNGHSDAAGAFGIVEVSVGSTEREDGDADMDMGDRRRTNTGPRTVRMRRGEIWLVKWSGVRDAVARGECELV